MKQWPAESGTLAKNDLDELPIKVCKFDIRIMESGVLLDKSCTGATPRPCGTLSDTHHRLHTLTKLRHQVPKSWKKMFHLISYAANPIKREGQQFKPKLVTKQTPSTEPKVNSFNKSRYVYTGSKQCLASGPLRILQNKPHQQTRSQQFKQHLRPTEANPINKPESNSPNQILEPTKQTPSQTRKTTGQQSGRIQVLLLWEGTHTHNQPINQPTNQPTKARRR